MEAPDSREFDLVLVGATGFVGRLTAQHLASAAPTGARIAMAGRSLELLASVRASLPSPARDWPMVVLDVTDAAQAAALAARTRVLVTTVGPYLRYGLALVEACARAGTDYADLTGETLFVRESVDRYDASARDSGARIVHACGFDSIPSDLGVGLTAALASRDGHPGLGSTVLHVRSIYVRLSGGTFDSMRQQIVEIGSEPALRQVAADPMTLAGAGGAAATRPSTAASGATRRGGRRRLIGREPRTGIYHARFVMGGFNRQIVLRSNEISGRPYGSEFRYREVMDTGTGLLGAARAVALTAASTALLAGLVFAPTRRLLDLVLPKPGEGPSEKTRRRGHFAMEVEATTANGARYRTRVAADQDPGYDATAVMLGQSGLALAYDQDLPDRAGVLTPMTAFGEALAARLRIHGFAFDTVRLDPGPVGPDDSL